MATSDSIPPADPPEPTRKEGGDKPPETTRSAMLQIMVIVVTSVLGLGTFAVHKIFFDDPASDLKNLHTRQEELLHQMQTVKFPTEAELSSFSTTSSGLAKWASAFPADHQSALNMQEIDNLHLRLLELVRPDPGLRQTRHPQPRTASDQPALSEVTVILYNGASEPELFVNERRAQIPEYSSGLARLRLPAGHYRIRAEYPNRTCTATVGVPAGEAIPADCNLK